MEIHLFQSIFPLPNDTYLHPSLIHSCLSLVKAMRTHFYRGLLDTQDDGGDYNGILFQDVGSVTQSLWNFHKTSVTYKSLGHYHKAPALGCIAVRPQVHKKKGTQNV